MLRRAGVVGLLVCAVVAFGGVAWAHVTLTPTSVVKGTSDVEIGFRVPNEETTAVTKLQVFLPSNPPFLGVLAQPMAGWTDAVVTTKLAKPIQTDDGPVTDVVSEVTWTATSAATGIKPGEYGKFEIIVGQIPDTATAVTLKALQTYANGDIVHWIEGPTGDHPAPILTLAATADTTATTANGSGSTPTTTGQTAATLPTNIAKTSDVNSAKTLSAIGIGVGVVALVLALAAFVLGRRPTAKT